MSTSKKLPTHGTRARYRLEIKKKVDGTPGKPCDRCKSANAKAAADARARRKVKSTLHLVPPLKPDTTADTTADAPPSDPPPAVSTRMFDAVTADLAKIPEADKVPFHDTLTALALEAANEADAMPTPAARAAARKQLFEVLKSLLIRKEGDGSEALDLLLADRGFGVPLVSDRSS